MTPETNKTIISRQTIENMHASQVSIPVKYDINDYYGSCMRFKEDQNADFLEDFINDVMDVAPSEYDLFNSLLSVCKNTKYKRLKNLIEPAQAKLDKCIARHKKYSYTFINNLKTEQSLSNKYSVLDNKKKMLSLTAPELYKLGQDLYSETRFSTTKLKNRFICFINYKIEQTIVGKMPIDNDFIRVVDKFAPGSYQSRYKKWLSHAIYQKKLEELHKYSQSVYQNLSDEEKEEKNTGGFLGKVKGFFSRTTKKIVNTVKSTAEKLAKPLMITGLFAASVFGGKKALDYLDQDNVIPNQPEKITIITPHTSDTIQHTSDTTTYVAQKSEFQQPIQHSDTINAKQTKTNPQTTITSKTIAQLQSLKATNPIDRHMDVNKTAEKLFNQFGSDTYSVVLACKLAPYALNDYMHFNFRPSTHNMLEYMTKHTLSHAERSALNKFITNHIHGNKIDLSGLNGYTIKNLKQLRDYKMQNQR